MGVRIRTILKRHRILSGVSVIILITACILWYILTLTRAITENSPFLAIGIAGVCLFGASILLLLRFFLPPHKWVKIWLIVSPVMLGSTLLIPALSPVVAFCLIPLLWLFFALWGYYRYYPLTQDHRLHKARFARRDEVGTLYSEKPLGTSLLIGVHPLTNHFALVRPTQTRRELGNVLIVGRTRGGKGLRITAQLLSWQHSAIVNDIKGELFKATAGYRSTLGKVFVIDPTGIGHRYDPLLSKTTESKLYAAAARLLYKKEEKDAIFTKRATNILTQLFLAARIEQQPPLPYVRSLIKCGLTGAVERLQQLNPDLATSVLDTAFENANFADKFLLHSWGTLTADMKPLLTEEVVKCFTASDVTAEDIMCGEKPITVYIRLPEEDLVALSPLVRLIWGSLIEELIATYDKADGKGCQPVLLEIDEAGRAPIPSLAEHATTVVGRGISIDMSIQSLAQLRVEYGEDRAQALLDNMDTQIYYRQRDITTAEYISRTIGSKSGYAHSQTERVGQELSQGLSEQGVPLMTPQDIMQMRDEKIICFHGRLPPFVLRRVDWRDHPIFTKRHQLPVPELSPLPPVTDIPALTNSFHTSKTNTPYVDFDRIGNQRRETNGIVHRLPPGSAREVTSTVATLI
jgi:type IV secretion system protein VirD4